MIKLLVLVKCEKEEERFSKAASPGFDTSATPSLTSLSPTIPLV
jgi:hypothetical protein